MGNVTQSGVARVTAVKSLQSEGNQEESLIQSESDRLLMRPASRGLRIWPPGHASRPSSLPNGEEEKTKQGGDSEQTITWFTSGVTPLRLFTPAAF